MTPNFQLGYSLDSDPPGLTVRLQQFRHMIRTGDDEPMTEQAASGWGMTVSRRFDTEAEANSAVEDLRQAGFLEGEIRVWQQKKPAVFGREDSMARIVEGLLAGGVVGGLGALFISVAFSWADSERTTEEFSVIATLIGAVAGAIIAAIGVSFISRKFAFSHPHEEHAGPGSVVTVSVGDREAQAKEVFDKLS